MAAWKASWISITAPESRNGVLYSPRKIQQARDLQTRRMRIYSKLGLQKWRPSYVDSKRGRRRSELLRNRGEIRL
jgi:hypothetical protein